MILEFSFFSFVSMSLIMGLTACFSDIQARNVGRWMIFPILIAFFAMTLNRKIFSDSEFYRHAFYSSDFLISMTLERGFELYTLAFAKMGSWSLYMLSFPAILLAGAVTLYKSLRVSPNYRIIIFLMLVWPFFWAYSMTGFRQSLAIAMGVFALAALSQKHLGLSLALIVLAAQFHSSAWLLLATLAAFKFRKSSKFFISIWAVSLVVTVFLPVGPLLAVLVGQVSVGLDYVHYFDGDFGRFFKTGLRPQFVVLSMLPIIALWFWRPTGLVRQDHLEAAFHGYLLLNAIGNLSASIPYSDRVYAYSWLIAPILLAVIWEEIPQWVRAGITAILVFLSATYSVYWLGK